MRSNDGMRHIAVERLRLRDQGAAIVRCGCAEYYGKPDYMIRRRTDGLSNKKSSYTS